MNNEFKDHMNALYENLKEKINIRARSGNVQEPIIKSCYKFFFEDEYRWKENYNGKPIYIIVFTLLRMNLQSSRNVWRLLFL